MELNNESSWTLGSGGTSHTGACWGMGGVGEGRDSIDDGIT